MTKTYRSYSEILKTDIATLDNNGLESFIKELREYRVDKIQCTQISANECNMLLSLAVSEKNSRSSSRMAIIAIWIAVASSVISLIGIVAGGCK